MSKNRNQLFLVLMLAGFVLWLTAPGADRTSAAGASQQPSSGGTDIRYYAGLSGAAIGGVTPGGVAEYRDRGDRRSLEVYANSINLASGTSLTVVVNGGTAGNATVDSLGNATLILETNNGQSVPVVNIGSTIQVKQGASTISSGVFSANPPPSPSPSPSGSPSGSPSASPSPTGSPSASPSPTGSPSASPSPTGSPSASPSPTGSPSASPSPSGSPSASPSPGGTPGAGEWNVTLTGPPLNGITPTGIAKYEFSSTPNSGDFRVRVDSVNLPAGTVLTIQLNGAQFGSMSLRTAGRGEFRLYYGAAPVITPGTTVTVQYNGTTILSGVFSGTPSPSPSPSGSPSASPSPSGSPGATPSPSPSGSPSASPTPPLGNCAISFSAPGYTKDENGNSVTLTINRNCTVAGASQVNLETASGTASDRTDFIQSSTQVAFAADEMSKTVNIILVNDNYVEGGENFSVTLENAIGGNVAGDSQATVTINDDDVSAPTSNPFESNEFFVRQHYSDFLSREPDAAGMSYWTSQMSQCGTDAACLRSRRLGVSAAFFIELEFQDTGSYIYRLYRASYNRRPTYLEFAPDRARIVGGTDLAQSKLNFSNEWVTRPAFRAEYPDAMIPEMFVNHLFDQSGLVGFADERQAQINGMYAGRSRAEVLRQVIEIQTFKQREYNPSFVLMQYFGYLRREPDQGGYDFWLSVLNQQPANARGMVCAFLTSREMQERFSSLAPRSNGECSGQP